MQRRVVVAVGADVAEDARDRAERKVDQARAIYDRHGVIVHGLWIATAVIIVVAGLAMTVFPGPATVVVPFGLVMLAVVFGWARRLLLVGVDQGADAIARYRRASTLAKALAIAAALCLVGGVVTWLVL